MPGRPKGMEKGHILISELLYSYSTISPQTLMEKVLPEYAIDAPLECSFFGRGANDTYFVRTPKKRYFLRVCRSEAFPLEALEFEAEAIGYLHKEGFSVAYPIARKSGGYLTEIAAVEGARFALLTAEAEGSTPDYEVIDNCRLVGQSVAQMHLLSSGFQTSYKRSRLDLDWLLESSMETIRGYFALSPDVLGVLENAANKARVAVEAVPKTSIDQGLCHGDLHGGNLHLHEGKITHFDFEECAFGYRAYDLATFKWGVWWGKQKAKRWSAFLEGYTLERTVSETDLSLIDPFVVIRELAELAYGIRHVQYFGKIDILAGDADEVCTRMKRFVALIGKPFI